MRLNYTLLLLSVFLFASQKGVAGINWVEVGVNGLTCSICSRSVEMSIARLEFVDSVVMSLEKTEGRVYLKDNVQANLKLIARAVVNAGFSVRFLRIQFNFDNTPVDNDGLFSYQGQLFEWVDFKMMKKPGDVVLKLVDSDFLPKKESAQWKKKMASHKASADQHVLHVIQEG